MVFQVSPKSARHAAQCRYIPLPPLRRSMFAHDDSVTGLRFVPRTHHFFTCGKDGLVKQWDADSFQRIQTLQGHCGEVLALAVSPDGTCGAVNWGGAGAGSQSGRYVWSCKLWGGAGAGSPDGMGGAVMWGGAGAGSPGGTGGARQSAVSVCTDSNHPARLPSVDGC